MRNAELQALNKERDSKREAEMQRIDEEKNEIRAKTDADRAEVERILGQIEQDNLARQDRDRGD